MIYVLLMFFRKHYLVNWETKYANLLTFNGGISFSQWKYLCRINTSISFIQMRILFYRIKNTRNYSHQLLLKYLYTQFFIKNWLVFYIFSIIFFFVFRKSISTCCHIGFNNTLNSSFFGGYFISVQYYGMLGSL